jgi:hypothetical protein
MIPVLSVGYPQKVETIDLAHQVYDLAINAMSRVENNSESTQICSRRFSNKSDGTGNFSPI